MSACLASSAANAPLVDWTGPPRKTNKASIPAAKESIATIIRRDNCAPIFIRLAWHDTGKFDKVRDFALRGRNR